MGSGDPRLQPQTPPPPRRGLAHRLSARAIIPSLPTTLKQAPTAFRSRTSLEIYRPNFPIGPRVFVFKPDRLLGYPLSRWTEEPTFWPDHIHEDDREQAVKYCKVSTGKNQDHDFEYRMVAADGRNVWMRDIVTLVRENGHVVKLRGLMIDITERRNTEEALHRSAQLLEASQSIARVGGVEVDLVNDTTFWTAETYRILEASPDVPITDLPQKHELYKPESLRILTEAMKAAREHGTGYDLELEMFTCKGRRIDVRSTCAVTLDEGRPVKLIGSLQDITERKQAETQLRKLSNIIEQAPISIVITDLRGLIEYTNPRFSKVTGYTAAEALGKNRSILKSGETPDEVYRDMWATLKRRQVWSGELKNKRKNGQVYLEMAVMSPILNDQGEATHYVALNDDVSAQQRRETEAADKLAQEHEVSEMKTRFISVTSHQFRTPMAAAMGSVEILANHLDRLSPEKRTELFGRINSSLNRMTVMLDEILLLNRIDAKRVEIRPTKIDLAEFVKDVIEGVRMGDTANHLFEFNEQSHVWVFVTDATLLNHIVENLLSNAVRYSPEGSLITVELAVVNNEFQLTVVDQGMGIPPEDQVRIFEPFERGSNVGAIKGTGLGLNIVKRMTELLSGTITLDSSKGEGSHFTLTLPQSPES